MFNNVRKFLALFSGAFFANRMRLVVNAEKEIEVEQRRQGKGKGRSSPAPKNAAIHKREAKKRKGRAINKARHAA
ncbi:hypothetical protein [Klebsiella pneumoniae]|uniref:hypothetical protein n=1 Tax=Klebsiella pneumoniae TaxID=573 RepID=UPI0034D180FB